MTCTSSSRIETFESTTTRCKNTFRFLFIVCISRFMGGTLAPFQGPTTDLHHHKLFQRFQGSSLPNDQSGDT